MAETTYNYSVNDDFPSGKINVDRFKLEIEQSAIVTALADISTNEVGGDILVAVKFKAEPPASDKTILDGDTTGPCGGLIGAHSGEPLPDDTVAYVRECPTDNKNKHLFIKGRQFDATVNTTTSDDYVLPEAMSLQGAIAEVQNFTDGDYVELFVLSPGDVVLGKYGESVYIPPSGKVGAISEGTTAIPASCKLRATYHSVATEGTQPKITVAYRLWK
jgi:hypothetical protein